MMHKTAEPPQAMTVVGGHVLADYTHRQDAGDGQYSYGVGLFVAPKHEAHSFVVWDVIYNDESDEFMCQSGKYCFSLTDALTAYKTRGGVV